MSDTASPAPVNWVVAKHNCRIERILDQLFEQVQADIAERDKLENLTPGIVIRVTDDREENRSFRVSRVSNSKCYGDKIIKSVCFSCEKAQQEDYIRISLDSKTLNVTRAWHDATGECHWYLDNKQAQPWQISEKSLTSILLG